MESQPGSSIGLGESRSDMLPLIHEGRGSTAKESLPVRRIVWRGDWVTNMRGYRRLVCARYGRLDAF